MILNTPQKIALNSFLSIFAKVSWTVIALATQKITTKGLGTDGFGKYTTILNFFFLLSSLGDLGLNQIVLREISKNKKKEGLIVGTAFIIRFCANLVLFFCALFFCFINPLKYESSVNYGILLITLGLFFTSGYQTLGAIFQKRLLAYRVAFAELLGRVVNFIWAFFCFKNDMDLLWFLGGVLVSWFVILLLVFILLPKEDGLFFRGKYQEAKSLLKQALSLGVIALVTTIYFRVDALILSRLKDFSAVGIYGVAYKVIESSAYFPSMLMGMILPFFAVNIVYNKKKFQEINEKTFRMMTLIGFGIAFGIFSLSDKIIPVISSGEDFYPAILVLKILSFSVLGTFFAQYFHAILITTQRQGKLLYVFIIAAIFNIVLNILFIPHFSYLAAAGIATVTELFVAFFSFFFIKNTERYFSISIFLKALGAGLFMTVFINIFTTLPIYMVIVLGGVSYLGASFVLGVFNKNDVMLFIKKNNVS